MDWNEAIDKALLTWYPKEHDLHFNPHHPLGKLCGEWGELSDDYMKSLYKPGYTLQPIDELGDILYYIRVLSYQFEARPRKIDKIVFPELDIEVVFSTDSTEVVISAMIYYASSQFLFLTKKEYTSTGIVFISAQYSALKEIGNRYNLSLDQIITFNWQKLKPGSERGEQWAKARVETDYVGRGKIGLLGELS